MKRFWQRLSKREKGLVALTLFVLVLVLGRYFLVSPFLEHWDWVKNQLEIQPQLLEKNLRYTGQKAQMMAAVEQVRGELKGLESSLLSGDTPSVSASDLQQTVQGLAGKEGIQVISTRVLSPEPMGPFTKIAIQMEVSGQIDQVTNFIKGVDSADKLLVVDELNIRSLISPIAAARPPNTPQASIPNLRTSVTVSGFARATLSSAGNGSVQSKGKTGGGTAPTVRPRASGKP